MKTSKIILISLVALVAACNNDKKTEGAAPGAAPAAAAAEPSCDDVVAKMLSFQPGSGEPEKKLLTKACPDMPKEMKSCVVAAKTKADYDACSQKGGGKLVK